MRVIAPSQFDPEVMTYHRRVDDIARSLPRPSNPEFVDGFEPNAFSRMQEMHRAFELDEAIDDGRVPAHEIENMNRRRDEETNFLVDYFLNLAKEVA